MDTPRSQKDFNWDDLRIFVAVMKTASLRKASAHLGVSRQTVARRLGELEAQLGIQLFERGIDGLSATAEASALVEAARAVEQAIGAVARTADGLDSELRGSINVTMPPPVASDLLMPDLVAFARKWPKLDIHINASLQLEDLAKRSADVAIRFMPHGRKPDVDLVGRKVATCFSAVYGSGSCWLGQPGLPATWYKTSPFPDHPVRGFIGDGAVLRAACNEGMGFAFLPCFIAEPQLERRSDPVPAFDAWVVVHGDLRRTPRFRVFRDAMVEALKSKIDRLQGRA